MKTVIVLDPKYPQHVLLNAVGHLTLGMGATINIEVSKIRNFETINRYNVSQLSDHPLIIMRSKKKIHLLKCFFSALGVNIYTNVFLETHLINQPEEQHKSISKRELDQSEIIAICLFGQDDILKTLTKRFSLL